MMSEIDKHITELAEETSVALEIFLERILSMYPPSMWRKLKLVRQQSIKDSVIETAWTVRLIERR